ncbi:hypothetical protein PJIAN_3106 [Paludibacter jiangxiensis]|uniref:Uncharacterized protein n=1 Tax=Paludibacter jiangxiensis TaxID=681398 RepID=A0A170ZLU2_9BACT|nr:hypothetical protein PJIAN_3106 [Paludibacter jiangxiensis]
MLLNPENKKVADISEISAANGELFSILFTNNLNKAPRT